MEPTKGQRQGLRSMTPVNKKSSSSKLKKQHRNSSPKSRSARRRPMYFAPKRYTNYNLFTNKLTICGRPRPGISKSQSSRRVTSPRKGGFGFGSHRPRFGSGPFYKNADNDNIGLGHGKIDPRGVSIKGSRSKSELDIDERDYLPESKGWSPGRPSGFRIQFTNECSIQITLLILIIGNRSSSSMGRTYSRSSPFSPPGSRPLSKTTWVKARHHSPNVLCIREGGARFGRGKGKLSAKEKEIQEAARLKAEKQIREEYERKARELATQLEKEKEARLAAERKIIEEAARIEKEKLTREEEQRLAREKEARDLEERLRKERNARLETERKAKEEAARLEAERIAREEALRKAKEEAARLEAERIAREKSEFIARQEAQKVREQMERLMKEKADRLEAERAERERRAEEEADRRSKEEARRMKEAAEREAEEESKRQVENEWKMVQKSTKTQKKTTRGKGKVTVTVIKTTIDPERREKIIVETVTVTTTDPISKAKTTETKTTTTTIKLIYPPSQLSASPTKLEGKARVASPKPKSKDPRDMLGHKKWKAKSGKFGTASRFGPSNQAFF
eukprot:jgi/Bigna1/90427/estExt_fgenesh1_pg.C_700051